MARALLAQVGRPVAAPSANRSGRVSPTTAAHVLEELDGQLAAVLDTGSCPVGLESTVLDLTAAPALLRPGGVTAEVIENLIGPLAPATALRGPGMLASHYAPRRPLRLEARDVRRGEALLAFGTPPEGASAVFQLSEAGDLVQASVRLFEGLRYLDALEVDGIAAMPVPDHGLGRAVNDRLRRAAHR